MRGLALVIVLGAWPAWGASKAVDGVVNLNTATPEALALLPGIGPAKVETIVAYRKKHPFRTVDELVRIKGIGRKQVRALRAHLAVSGPTTATAIRWTRPPEPVVAPPPRPVARPLCVVRAPPRPQPAVRLLVNAVPLAARAYCLRPP